VKRTKDFKRYNKRSSVKKVLEEEEREELREKKKYKDKTSTMIVNCEYRCF